MKINLIAGLTFAFLLVQLAACTATPRMEKTMDAHATLAKTQSGHEEALISQEALDKQQAEMLEALSMLTTELTGQPLVDDNSVELLIDGPQTFEAMFKDMAKAKDHIHIETFILEDDKIGKQLAEILLERRKAGVDVRVIYDAIGSRELPEEFIKRLSDAGVEFYKFHPIDPTEDLRVWRTNNRNHRKVTVIDGKIGYTGGINISDVYARSSLSVSNPSNDPDIAWRDTHVRLVGPAVHSLQRKFIETWQDHDEKTSFHVERYYPKIEATGEHLVQVVSSQGGDNEEYNIYTTIIAAIKQSKKRIWITQAYFAPNEEFLEAIQAAAQRGVDVRLILPGVTDAPLVLQASRSDYDDLLSAGAKIYEWQRTTLHAKTAVIDSCWSTIGSANFDYRSFLHNNELNIVVLSGEFAKKMEEQFKKDLANSKQITLAEWRKRPITQRIKEATGNLLRYWF